MRDKVFIIFFIIIIISSIVYRALETPESEFVFCILPPLNVAENVLNNFRDIQYILTRLLAGEKLFLYKYSFLNSVYWGNRNLITSTMLSNRRSHFLQSLLICVVISLMY